MYELNVKPRSLGRQPLLPTAAPEALDVGSALLRARKVFQGYSSGMSLDGARLRQALRRPAASPALERERLFALGWLRWLEGDFAAAEPLFAESVERGRDAPAEPPVEGNAALVPVEPVLLLGRSAYWLARVRVLLGKANAIPEYEAGLRRLGGLPQATLWYVDLLWRAGRTDRAEQLWKSVRSNKIVAGCQEVALLDARAHLRRGELGPAERLLREADPTDGVLCAERQLLLAWVLAAQRQFDKALDAFDQASEGAYPEPALTAWRVQLEARQRLGNVPADWPTGAWRTFVAGQQERAAGRTATAADRYREALQVPAVVPFARYALACLDQDDVASVLALMPGLFFAVRCRSRQAVLRFAKREIGPSELLETLRQADNGGHRSRGGEHYRRLANTLQRRPPNAGDLVNLAEFEDGSVARGNALRVVLEMTGKLPEGEAGAVLRQLVEKGLPEEDAPLRTAFARAILREAALRRDVSLLDVAEGVDPSASVVAVVLRGEATTTDEPAAVIMRAARTLEQGQPIGDAERETLRGLLSAQRYRAVAVCLLTHDAAVRNEPMRVAELLEHADAWRGFRTGPPAWTRQTLLVLGGAHPTHPVWRQVLPRWLQVWPMEQLGAEAAALQTLAGVGAPGTTSEAPPGVDATAWAMHQASRALLRDEPRTALAFLRQVSPLPAAAEPALPQLERRAAARTLADRLARLSQSEVATGTLLGLVDILRQLPDSAPLLEAEDDASFTTRLEEWSKRTDLPPALHRHLAVWSMRVAGGRAEMPETERSLAWRRAWRSWLASGEMTPGLLDYLFAEHRSRVNALLARGDVGSARHFTDLVRQLPALVGAGSPLLVQITERVERFRDELAGEALQATREVMRFGDVPEGWRSDYERGLLQLRRLLALDRDNARLLTALVEICTEWFLDLYNTEDRDRLQQEVERYTPVAKELARLAAQSAEHPARPALSQFYKFRGFVEPNPTLRAGLYREALKLNPANDNVRELLSDMGEEES